MSAELILNHLKPLAQRSYANLSHDPDGTGERVIRDFSEEVEKDITDIASWVQCEEQKTLVSETTKKYIETYEKYLYTWLNSQCNCASSFITGGSNFPVARQQKRRRWADTHYTNFRTWRTWALKAIKKFYTPAVDPLTLNKQKLEEALKLQAFMKLVNSTHRAFMKHPETLEASELSDLWKQKIRSHVPGYSWIKHPFAPYQLTNNNARIRMYSERVKVLEEKNCNAVTIGQKEFPFSDGIVILNYAKDRIQIKHEEKPSRAIIDNIKSRGFRWSPINKVWQRQINNQSIYLASLITGISPETFNK